MDVRPSTEIELPVSTIEVIATLAPSYQSFELCWVDKNGVSCCFSVPAELTGTISGVQNQAATYLQTLQKILHNALINLDAGDFTAGNITITTKTNSEGTTTFRQGIIPPQQNPTTPAIIYEVMALPPHAKLLIDFYEQLTPVIQGLGISVGTK